MERTITLPPDDEKKDFPLFPIGTFKFQVTDWEFAKIKDTDQTNEDVIVVHCEGLNGDGQGKTILYRVNLTGDFLWLTKLFLKCLGLPHNGEVKVNPDEWIGKQFSGEVKHKDGYANIKKLIFKEGVNQSSEAPKTPDEINWTE